LPPYLREAQCRAGQLQACPWKSMVEFLQSFPVLPHIILPLERLRAELCSLWLRWRRPSTSRRLRQGGDETERAPVVTQRLLRSMRVTLGSYSRHEILRLEMSGAIFRCTRKLRPPSRLEFTTERNSRVCELQFKRGNCGPAARTERQCRKAMWFTERVAELHEPGTSLLKFTSSARPDRKLPCNTPSFHPITDAFAEDLRLTFWCAPRII